MRLKHICLILNWNYCIDSPCLTELFCSLHLFYKVILTKNYFVLAPLPALYAPGSSAARHFPVPFVHLARQLQDCTAGVKIGRSYAAAIEEFGWLPVSRGQQAGCCGWYWCQGKFLFRISYIRCIMDTGLQGLWCKPSRYGPPLNFDTYFF